MPQIQHNEVWFPLASGWEDGTQLLALGPRDGEFRPNVVISRESVRDESVDDYIARQLQMLRTNLRDFTLVKEGTAEYGRNAGYLREYRFTMDAKTLAQLQFYLVRGPTIYVMTYTNVATRMAATRKAAEEAFAAIRIG